jgi:dimethylglycine dehydrogenase
VTEHARVVVIGGGAVGCSVLYHLARLGWTDCLLIERNELTSGSTWHAAGNCPTFSTSWNIMKLQRYGTQLYGRLGTAVDYPINYHVTGSVRLAHSQARMDEFHHVAAMAHAQGIAYEMLTPEQARQHHPFMTTDGIKGALWDPEDGDIDPSQLTQALAKGARDLGSRIKRFTRVIGLARTGAGEWRVSTDKGDILCEIVVNAAGYRAGEIMALLDLDLPMVTLSHQYLVTGAIGELTGRAAKLPILRDPDVSYYLRQERDGLLLGPYEWDATAMWEAGIPDDFAHQLWNDDLGRLERHIEQAVARVPILGTGGVRRTINGPIPYGPDGNPFVGPAHGLPNFFQCNAFTFGIVQAGGAGKTLAEWVVQGEPEWDMWALDPRRYAGYATKTYALVKAVETYQNEYAIGFPYEERPAGRPARTTPLYDRLTAKGARFGARGGWERAAWFGAPGETAVDRPSFRRAERIWHDAVAAECRAVRDAVGLLDLGGFTKFFVEGPGAADWLDLMTCSRLPRLGRISLAYVLNRRGGIVSEFTITRLGPDRFYLVSAAAAEWHDEDLLRAHLPPDGSVRLEDASGRMGSLVLAGPRARDVLRRLTDADLSSSAFPWLTAREIDVGDARALALRVNYVGELGWELHLPIGQLGPVYDALCQAGAAFGLMDFGMYAMDSLRLDKCYRGWKQDLATEYTPVMAGLDRFVDLTKPDFPGRAALLAEQASGPRERFVPLLLDGAPVADAPACASVHHGGATVGLVTSGGWSYTLGRSVALAYVRSDLAQPGTRLAVDILGARCPATVGRAPLYDPDNARLKA